MQSPVLPSAPPPVPSRGRGPLTVVLCFVILTVVAFAFAALVLQETRVTTGRVTKPFVTFFTPILRDGNATVKLSSISPLLSPSKYMVNLASVSGVYGYIGGPTPMPTTTGGFVTIPLGPGACCDVYWTSSSGSAFVSPNDVFTVTGVASRLPSATSFVFSLNWAEDGSSLQSILFSTP